jgi:hypothetical protein
MTTLELTSNHEDARRIDRLAQRTRVLCVLFFFSRFPALIYQLTWQRALFRIFGVNIESVTIVVTTFARPRSRQPRGRLAVEAARHPVAAAAGRDRVAHRGMSRLRSVLKRPSYTPMGSCGRTR